MPLLTYDAIATTTLAAATSSVTFSSVPSNYTDLVVVCNIKGNSANIGCTLQLNGDTTTVYSVTQCNANQNPSITSNRYTAQSNITLTSNYTSGTNEWTSVVWNIMNYANTTTNKNVLARYARSTYESGFSAGLWRSTSAINQLVFGSIANSFAIGSIFTIYGIRAA